MARITDGLFKEKMMTWTFCDTPSDYVAYGWIPELDEKVDSNKVEDRLIAVKKHYGLEVLSKDPDWRVRLAVVRQGYLWLGAVNDPSERVRNAVEEYRMTRMVDSREVFVPCKKFKEIRQELLTEYAESEDLPIGGTFNNNGKHYGHILDIDEDKARAAFIEKYNLLPGLRFDGFISPEKVHKYAHHLNSSQVLCYNFFRPMLNDDHTPKQELIALLKEQGVSISPKARCDFEYDDYTEFKKEGTEFDFHIADEDTGTEVFFEIKYTEEGFGGAKDDNHHEEKFDSIYSKMLKKCQCLKDDMPLEDFLKSYQLYRNVLRITDKHMYTVFITAKGNAKTYMQLDAFLKRINDEYKGNVIALYWEDLIEKGHPLYDKYIAV